MEHICSQIARQHRITIQDVRTLVNNAAGKTSISKELLIQPCEVSLAPGRTGKVGEDEAEMRMGREGKEAARHYEVSAIEFQKRV